MSKSQAQLITEINANFPDNTIGLITPALQRTTYIDGLNVLVPINSQTGTTYTLQDSDNGGIVSMSNASPITVTLPASLSTGFSCLVEQEGLGQITFAPGSGATMHAPSAANKSLGQYATVYLYVISGGGSAAAWRLSGLLTS